MPKTPHTVVLSLVMHATAHDVAQARTLTWAEFVDFFDDPLPGDTPKADLPLWSAAGYRVPYVNDANVDLVYALGFDVDEAPIPDAATLRAALAPYRAVASTSPSSTADAPRWRVVFAVSRPMTGAEYRRVWAAVRAGLPFPVGKQSKNQSRMWYFPRVGADGSYTTFATEGAPIDVDAVLDGGVSPQPVHMHKLGASPPIAARDLPTPSEKSQKSEITTERISGAPDRPADAPGRLADDAAALLAAHWPARGARVDARLALAGACWRSGFDEADATRFVQRVHALLDDRGDMDDPALAGIVAATYARAAEGRPIAGWPALARAGIPGAIVKAAQGMLGENARAAADLALRLESKRVETADAPPPERPLFPTDALPPVLRDYVVALATSTRTPVDMAASLALGACAGAVAGKVDLLVSDGYVEPLNLFVLVAMPPGNLKSAVLATVTAPLHDVEAQLVADSVTAIARAEAEREVLEVKLKRRKADLAKLADADRGQEWRAGQVPGSPTAAGGLAIDRDIVELSERLARIEVPAAPRLLCGDVTMEKLAAMLAEQKGRLICAADEASLLDVAAGRYSKNGGSSFETLLQGHAGTTIRIDRVGRGEVHVPRPRLTLVLTVQPTVVEQLVANRAMRGKGLLARFLFSVPTSPLGGRNMLDDPPPIPLAVARAYRERLIDLAKAPGPQAPPGGGCAEIPLLTLSPEARRVLRAFSAEVEPRLRRDEGDLEHIVDWAAKLPGAVARIAGVLHCATTGRLEGAVDAERMDGAVALGRYYLAQAQHVLGELSAPQATQDGDALLKWLRTRPWPEGVTLKAIRRLAPRALRDERDRILKALGDLVDRGLLTPTDRGWIVN